MNNPVAASHGDVRQPQTPANVMKVETGHGVNDSSTQGTRVANLSMPLKGRSC
jgi:hypothetical protein